MMRKKILPLLLVATSMMGQVRAQNTVTATASTRDSVAHQVTFFFQSDIGDCIQKSISHLKEKVLTPRKYPLLMMAL